MPSEQKMSELRWMIQANRRGVGLYGPTFRRFGSVPEIDELVEQGLAQLKETGYWITPRGRAYVAEVTFDGGILCGNAARLPKR
jgi:hypothetical protein